MAERQKVSSRKPGPQLLDQNKLHGTSDCLGKCLAAWQRGACAWEGSGTQLRVFEKPLCCLAFPAEDEPVSWEARHAGKQVRVQHPPAATSGLDAALKYAAAPQRALLPGSARPLGWVRTTQDSEQLLLQVPKSTSEARLARIQLSRRL